MADLYSPDAYIAALVDLHRGLPRQGPGDTAFSRRLLDGLTLPPHPRMADLGCGSGAGALLLAEHLSGPVRAVDSSAVFIAELEQQAQQRGLSDRIIATVGDMGQLDWPPGALDLLWSEGAAYNLGFEPALALWHPLLAPGGIAVISELSWFDDNPPPAARAYWQEAYPTLGTEAENQARAERTGWQVLATHRLPSAAWWDHYYTPLRQRIAQQKTATPTSAMATVIEECETEMALFVDHSDAYGYTFYVLQVG